MLTPKQFKDSVEAVQGTETEKLSCLCRLFSLDPFNDFNSADLKAVTIQEDALINYRFLGTNLMGAKFDNCTLNAVNFDRATLVKACFSSGVLNHCDFQGVDMTDSSWTGLKMQFVNVLRSKLQGIYIEQVDFEDSVLANNVITIRGMKRASFRDCRLTWEILGGVIEDSTFLGSSKLINGKMTDCTFSHCKFLSVQFVNTEIIGCKYDRCDLSQSSFISCDLSSCDFYSSDVFGAYFEDNRGLSLEQIRDLKDRGAIFPADAKVA